MARRSYCEALDIKPPVVDRIALEQHVRVWLVRYWDIKSFKKQTELLSILPEKCTELVAMQWLTNWLSVRGVLPVVPLMNNLSDYIIPCNGA